MVNNNNTTPGTTGLAFEEPLVFEISEEGRSGFSFNKSDIPEANLSEVLGNDLIRNEIIDFPEISEPQAMRHFVRMSQWNFGVESGFYPLGSCTMKYNPRINENMARLSGFVNTHPSFPDELVQGNLELIYNLEKYLSEIAGMDATTLQPAAGAHGELTGLMAIRAYHLSQGNKRSKVLVPDSSHGTNPASSNLCGYKAVEVKSSEDGFLLPEAVEEAMDEEVAALMITNPNTLGIFEQQIDKIAKIVHNKGGLLYCDGANMNALLGVARPGDMGFDVIQYNLHKTFSTPHGGGGPGSGPVGVKKILEPFLPVPRVEKDGENYKLNYDIKDSMGKIKGYQGNFGTLIRAYTYIRELGQENIRKVSEYAVLNANYIRSQLKDTYHLPYNTDSMHEVIFTDKNQSKIGVSTMDIAKRLLDLGFHAPTIYFPLVVHAAMMIEPTETESKLSIDEFISAMLQIDKEIAENAEEFVKHPVNSFRQRLDETQAARKPVLRWKKEE